MEYKKLLGVAGLVTLVATTSVAYMSSNGGVEKKINQLYDIAEGFRTDLRNSQGQNRDAQEQLTQKQAILDGIKKELGANDTTLDELKRGLSNKLFIRQQDAFKEVARDLGIKEKPKDNVYTSEFIVNWVNEQSQTERDTIATNLGLPVKEGGYTADEIVTAMQTKIEQDKQAKINDLAKKVGLPTTAENGSPINYDETTFINEVKQYINEVNDLEKRVGKGDGSLVAKVQKMINDLEQANQEEQAQLATAKNKIKALGYCPEHDSLVQLSSDGTCPTCKGGGGTTNPPAGDARLTELQTNLNNAKESFISASRGLISDEAIELFCNGDLVIVSNSEITATTEAGESLLNQTCNEIALYGDNNLITAGVNLAEARQALEDYQAQQQ